MKKITLLILAIILCTSLMAQIKVNHAKPVAVPLNMERQVYNTGIEQGEEFIPALRASSMVSTNWFYTTIGETYYNTCTNRNARNTIGFKPKSNDGAAVWMKATPYVDRKTSINYYNVNQNSWAEYGNEIETMRTGWGTHVFTNTGEVVVSHNGTTGLVVNTRDVAGQGNWQQSILIGPQYTLNGTPTTALLWPTMVSNGNTVHLVCVTDYLTANTNPSDYEPNPIYGYLGFPTLPLYYRSTDGGKTWEQPRNFREYGMTNFECFEVAADGYVLSIRGNHLVLLYNDKMGFVNYMESKDGGDTWVKKTIYNNGMVFAQSNNVEPRLLPTTASVFIDEDHKVHVAFSAQCCYKKEGTVWSWGGMPVGLIYWNDERPPIDWQELRGWEDGAGHLIDYNWEEYPGYIELPSVTGLDKYYIWEGTPPHNSSQFNNHGWAIYPRILAKEGRVYVAYQSPLDYPFIYNGYLGAACYRGIFITVSEDNGQTWDVQHNTSWISYHPDVMVADWSNYIYPTYSPNGDPEYHPESIMFIWLSENAYPSMSYNYKGNLFMLQWANQYHPFLYPNGLQDETIYIYTFTQDLRNIPAYRNIQEIYKNLWNDGNDPVIDLPPSSCERPVEPKGVLNGNDAILNWEEPDYISSTLLGYNVYRNGVKINTSPITETHFTDAGLPLEIFTYRISAVYDDCESSLTYGVTLYHYEFCESPLNLSADLEERTVSLTWAQPANIDGVLLKYNVYRDGVKIGQTSSSVRAYSDANLPNGTYTYKVSAVYEHCESELTDGVEVFINLAINDFQTLSFEIFPNPANNEITFKGNGLARVEIYEVQGRKLAEYENVKDVLQINISQYQNGIYFVKMYSNNNQMVTKRLVIVK